jgi:hypothetical protein
MAVYNNPPLPLDDQLRPAQSRTSWLPLIAACIAAVVLMAVVFPHSFGIVGLNPRPALQTVTAQPTPETAVVAPMPSPTSEPRPTQAPIQ